MTAAIAVMAALSAVLAVCAAPASAAAGYDVERCGNTSGRVLLTLDDWSVEDPDRIVRAGDFLQGRGVRAAFFLVNNYAERYPRITAALRRQGHWVGNHSYSHPHLPALTEKAAREEIRNGLRSTLLRPPFGDYGPRETALAAELGYRICTWTLDTRDWVKTGEQFPGPDVLRARVREAPAAVKRSGVVLGHLFTRFPDALPGIVDDLHGQGYRLCRNSGPTTENIRNPLDC